MVVSEIWHAELAAMNAGEDFHFALQREGLGHVRWGRTKAVDYLEPGNEGGMWPYFEAFGQKAKTRPGMILIPSAAARELPPEDRWGFLVNEVTALEVVVAHKARLCEALGLPQDTDAMSVLHDHALPRLAKLTLSQFDNATLLTATLFGFHPDNAEAFKDLMRGGEARERVDRETEEISDYVGKHRQSLIDAKDYEVGMPRNPAYASYNTPVLRAHALVLSEESGAMHDGFNAVVNLYPNPEEDEALDGLVMGAAFMGEVFELPRQSPQRV